MKAIVLFFSILIAGFGSCTKGQAATVGQAMNVSGAGSDYIFVYRGNNPNEFDALVAQGLNNLSGWTATCGPNQPCQGTTYIIDHVTQSDTDSLLLYTANSDGTVAFPDSGRFYSFSSPVVYPSYVIIGSGTAGSMTFNENSSITTNQQSKVDIWTNRTITDGNRIYIEQVSGYGNTVTMNQDGNNNLTRAMLDGNSNSITVNQGVQGIGKNEIKINTVGDSNTLNINQARTTQGTAIGGNGHYQAADINGSNNTLTTQQSNTGGVGGHYMENVINGNQNNVMAKQTDNGNKIMFTSVTGNNNTVEAVQKGTGQHYLENKLTGNNNSVSALQEGSIANRATLDLTNAGGPASVILQQNGGQNVTVITSCATTGGCAPITVRQGY